MLGLFLGKLLHYQLLSALMAVPGYWDNNVMDTNCHSDMSNAMGKCLMALLTTWEDTSVRSNVVDKWEDS